MEISRPDAAYGFHVKSCFAFNKQNSSVPLIDDRGCPVNSDVISPFVYDDVKKNIADAQLRSMFRFPDSSEVHFQVNIFKTIFPFVIKLLNFQCDVGLCRGSCPQPTCSNDVAQSRALNSAEGVLMAATSVFVVDPGEAPLIAELCEDGTVHPAWLLWLCVALGILFLIMLIINVFLCSAMTCACARTEIIEKEPSIIEDYDPYRSWHGSQYGSR